MNNILINKQIYHLHIPKTGGQYVISTILFPLANTLSSNNIKNASVGHAAWRNITDKTYVISSFRNPAQRTVSHFCFYLKSSLNVDNIKPSKSELFKWIYQNKSYISNFQSKNLIYEGSQRNAPFFFMKDQKFLNIDNINKDAVLEKAKRIDLLLKNEHLGPDYSQWAQNKICKDLNINKQHGQIGSFFNKNTESSNLYRDLSSNEIDYIFEINAIDSEIYFNESLFDIPPNLHTCL